MSQEEDAVLDRLFDLHLEHVQSDNIDDVPTDDVPTDDVPADDVPTEDVPTEDVPTKDVPTKDVPADDVPSDIFGLSNPNISFRPSQNQKSALFQAFAPKELTRDREMLGAVLAQITPYGGDLDPERQKYAGQRKVAGTVALDYAGVDRALKTGDPQLLEAIDFGSAADGEPFLHFLDHNGNSQYVNVTPHQWLALIKNRSQAREELMFRRRAEEDREALNSQWNQLRSVSDLSSDELMLQDLLWQVDPKSALAGMQSAMNQHTVSRNKDELLGASEALGEPAFQYLQRMAEELGWDLPPVNNYKDWVKLLNSAARGASPDDPLKTYRGQKVSNEAAMSGGIRDLARFEQSEKALDDIGQMYRMGLSSPPDPSDQNLMSLSRVSAYNRAPQLSHIPDMSFPKFARAVEGRSRDDVRDMFVDWIRVAQMSDPNFKLPDVSQWERKNKDTSGTHYEVDDGVLMVLQPVYDRIGSLSQMLGWDRMGTDEQVDLVLSMLSALRTLGQSQTTMQMNQASFPQDDGRTEEELGNAINIGPGRWELRPNDVQPKPKAEAGKPDLSEQLRSPDAVDLMANAVRLIAEKDLDAREFLRTTEEGPVQMQVLMLLENGPWSPETERILQHLRSQFDN